MTASATVVVGDCLDAEIPSAAQLVYADPPFGRGVRRTSGSGGYDDLVTGDRYAKWLLRRLLRCFAVVERGWLVLHHCPELDPRVLAHLERAHGRRAGSVPWQDAWVSGFRSRAKTFWPRVHDVLHFWRVGDPPFHPTMEPPPKGYKRRGGGGGGERPLGDLWVGPWSPGHLSFSREKTGWPDQKPLALLDRVVRATTDPGDLVLDPFCGSGTTLEASLRAGRSAWGVDASERAVEIARGRCGTATEEES